MSRSDLEALKAKQASGGYIRRATVFVTGALRFVPPLGVFLVLAVGIWGYRKCLPDLSWFDAAYHALQFFALGETHCGPPTPVALQFARFLAALLIFLAVIRLVFVPLWSRLRVWVQAMVWGSQRNVLIGYGALNEEVAREFAKRGEPLTIVAREFDGAARGFAATARAVLLERDLRNAGAMDGLFLARAQRIVIACGDDSLTLELAQMISDQYGRRKAERESAWYSKVPVLSRVFFPVYPPPEEVIHAHFTSTELHHQLQRSRDLGLRRHRRFAVFSIRDETARFLFARAWLVEKARDMGQARLHVVVVGGGDLGLSVTREAVHHGCSAGLEPPMVTVVDCDLEAAKGRFCAAIPHLFDETIPAVDRPIIRFRACRAEAMKTETAQDVGTVTAWVICCPEDATNLTLGMQLEIAMQKGEIPPAPIYARQWQGGVHKDHILGLGQADPLHLMVPFGNMPDVVPTLPFLDPQPLQLAKGINAQYQTTKKEMDKKSRFADLLDRYGEPPWGPDEGPPDHDLRQQIETVYDLDQKRFAGAWDDLSQEEKLSNLAPAQQAALRLWELGFEWPERHAGKLPKVQDPYIAAKVGFAAVQNPDQNAVLVQVAAAEHRRWMVERALRGWSVAKETQRSNSLRLHPNFQTFCALPAEEARHGIDLREFDVSTLRGILKTLSHNDTGIVARLPEQALPASLVQDVEIEAEGRLTLTLPQKPDPEALARGVVQVVKWMGSDRSCSIRLLPETPIAHVDLTDDTRKQLAILHEAALANGIHIWLQMPDARNLRRDIAKLDPSLPEATVD
jgi:hypothetical protein